jgi:hypothetical protein
VDVTSWLFRPAVKRGVIAGLGLALVATTAAAVSDFGVRRDERLRDQSEQLFGVGKPLQASSSKQLTQQEALADPTRLVSLAGGLHAHVAVLSAAAPTIDQISFWPDDEHPTHLIFCNEQGTAVPGLLRARLSDGLVETIVTGTTACDPTRRTP